MRLSTTLLVSSWLSIASLYSSQTCDQLLSDALKESAGKHHYHNEEDNRTFPPVFSRSTQVPSNPFHALCKIVEDLNKTGLKEEWYTVPIATHYHDQGISLSYYGLRYIEGEDMFFGTTGKIVQNITTNPSASLQFWLSSLGIALTFYGQIHIDTRESIRQKIWDTLDSHSRVTFTKPSSAYTSQKAPNPEELDQQLEQEINKLNLIAYSTDGKPTPEKLPHPPSQFTVLRFTPHAAKLTQFMTRDSLPIAIEYTKTPSGWTKQVLIPGN